MLRMKRKILMASSVFGALVLVLSLALMVLPKAFATVEHLGYSAGTLYESSEDQYVSVSLLATDDIDLYAVGGDFALHEATDGDTHFTLEEMRYSTEFNESDVISNEIGDSVGRFSWLAPGDEGVQFGAGDVIWTGTYSVLGGTLAGTYNINLSDVSIELAGDAGSFSGDIVAQVTINEKAAQAINFEASEITKTYGDAEFVNALTETTVYGTITFESSDENVATVDEFGNVTIVGVGETIITAKASETEAYAEAEASYTLNVEKQDLSIIDAAVPDKTYDGTLDSAVGIVTLSDESLSQGSDYTATAVFNDANVGTDKTVTVTVNLSDEIAGFYNFSANTFDVEDVTITPHTLTAADINLEYTTIEADGTAKEPGVTVMIGDFTVGSAQYGVEYANNINKGTATVTVTAADNSNLAGMAEATFEITSREVINIYGIEDQTVVYTGSPVVLAGTLAVADDLVDVNDIDITWYDADGITEISQPTNVGSYVVVYSYLDSDYEGSLTVNFEIEKAVSPYPAESSANLKVLAGSTLAVIDGDRTFGFAWEDDATVVIPGSNTYAASYTYNNDTTNYTTLELAISVYGLTEISVNASVEGVGGAVVVPDTAIENQTIVVEVLPDTGYEIKSLTINGYDATSAIEDGELKIVAGTTDLSIVASFRKVYIVVSGNGESYVIDGISGARFVIDADYSLFSAGGSVYVDGALVDPSYYTDEPGSTVITLSASFLKALPAGTHTLAVMFSDGGVARATFELTTSSESAEVATPDTGIFTARTGGASVAGGALVIMMLASVAIVARKKFARSKVDFDKKA